MHIGLVSPAWPADHYANGIVTYVHHLRGELLKQGHRVSVFANEIGSTNTDFEIYQIAPSIMQKIGWRFHELLRGPTHYPFSWGNAIASTIRRIHHTNPIDVIEMEESFGWCAAVQRRVGVPVVVKLHGPAHLTLIGAERSTAFGRTRLSREREGLKRMSAIISPSNSALTPTLEKYGLTPKVCRVIPNPLAIDECVPLWDLKSCAKKTILFVGRFDQLKGGDTILHAFKRLLEVDKDLKLIFVGPDRGIISDQGTCISFANFRDALFTRSQIADLDYLGQVSRDNIVELRRRAHITVVPSRWESQGYTALEAMIQGCPVVAFATSGLNEAIEHEQTGLLARPGDVDDLCQQILRIMRDPALGQTLGERARRSVLEKHSPAKIAEATIDVYHDAISAR